MAVSVVLSYDMNVLALGEETAASLGLRTGLYRKLTALMDKSPVAFIRSIRLQRAAEMLAGGGRSVAEVAERTGFGSTGYFSKCFQAEFGCRPSDYPKAADTSENA